jgi:chorismate dehydratase
VGVTDGAGPVGRPLRVGRVDFINTFPVRWALDRHLAAGLADEVVGVPSALNELLATGQVDVANVSSVEYARHADRYLLLPSLCVGSCGAVESVQLVTDLPLSRVRSVAVTPQSASSVVLVRILLPDATIEVEGRPADARLLIGDAALASAFADPTPHHDLGALWRERTGLPMVFAVWAARTDPGVDEDRLRTLDVALAAAVAEAAASPASVARDAAGRYGFPAGYLARYFEKLRYRFGPRERAGLSHFYDLAVDVGALEHAPPLRFLERAPATATATAAR